MATRINRSHGEEIRQKIQASQLINRLTDHVNGEVEMSATQVAAALGLLKKAIPDLAAVTLSGDDANPVNIVQRIERVIVDGQNTPN